MSVADKPDAFSPEIALKASLKSSVELPFKYRAEISASMLGTRRMYLGRISLLKLPPSRCRTRGWQILTGPTPSHQIPFRQETVTHHAAFSRLSPPGISVHNGSAVARRP